MIMLVLGRIPPSKSETFSISMCCIFVKLTNNTVSKTMVMNNLESVSQGSVNIRVFKVIVITFIISLRLCFLDVPLFYFVFNFCDRTQEEPQLPTLIQTDLS